MDSSTSIHSDSGEFNSIPFAGIPLTLLKYTARSTTRRPYAPLDHIFLPLTSPSQSSISRNPTIHLCVLRRTSFPIRFAISRIDHDQGCFTLRTESRLDSGRRKKTGTEIEVKEHVDETSVVGGKAPCDTSVWTKTPPLRFEGRSLHAYQHRTRTRPRHPHNPYQRRIAPRKREKGMRYSHVQ